jgi:hypothetical protein
LIASNFTFTVHAWCMHTMVFILPALPIPKSWANPRVYCVVATNINIYPGGEVHTANIPIRFHAKNNLKGVRRNLD